MNSKVAVFYYTQTGQSLQVVQSICGPLVKAELTVIYKEIVPTESFPFPWSGRSFFQAFPESREAIPCDINQIDLQDIEDANAVIIVYPVWFLSVSIPTHAFFQHPQIQEYLKGKPIITVTACRNMWLMAHRQAASYIETAGGKLYGHIVLQDRHHNLVSVLTIVRWLLYGKKEKNRLFPAAGVSDADIQNASVFGEILQRRITAAHFEHIQDEFFQAGAIDYKPAMIFVEKVGYRIFGLWAKFILKRGKQRTFWLSLFKYYLFAAIYIASPVGLTFFWLSYPFRIKKMEKQKKEIFLCQ